MSGVLKLHQEHEKEYIVTVNGKLNEQDVETLEKGILLEDGVTYPAVIKEVPDAAFNPLRADEAAKIERCAEAEHFRQVPSVVVFEAPDGRMLVNEVNHTMEFRGSYGATGVDIAGKIVDYLLKIGEGMPVDLSWGQPVKVM